MFNITTHQFTELIKKGWSLDVVYILFLIEQGVDVSDMAEGSVKIATLIDTCYRKGLLTHGEQLTLEGKGLITFLQNTDVKLIYKKRKPPEDDFKKFWDAFPSTDTFTYNGVKFEGTRALKTNKEECKIKFNAIINEGGYSVNDIVGAVEYDVLQKKKNSFNTKQNKLTFIQNSLTYLRQRSFEPFIELMKQEQKEQPIKDIYGGVNI